MLFRSNLSTLPADGSDYVCAPLIRTNNRPSAATCWLVHCRLLLDSSLKSRRVHLVPCSASPNHHRRESSEFVHETRALDSSAFYYRYIKLLIVSTHRSKKKLKTKTSRIYLALVLIASLFSFLCDSLLSIYLYACEGMLSYRHALVHLTTIYCRRRDIFFTKLMKSSFLTPSPRRSISISADSSMPR